MRKTITPVLTHFPLYVGQRSTRLLLPALIPLCLMKQKIACMHKRRFYHRSYKSIMIRKAHQNLIVVDEPFSYYKSKWAKIRKNRERPTRKWVIRLKGVGQYNRNQPLKAIKESATKAIKPLIILRFVN